MFSPEWRSATRSLTGMTGAELQLHAVNYLPTRRPGRQHSCWKGEKWGNEREREETVRGRRRVAVESAGNDSGSRVPVAGSNCNKLTALITLAVGPDFSRWRASSATADALPTTGQLLTVVRRQPGVFTVERSKPALSGSGEWIALKFLCVCRANRPRIIWLPRGPSAVFYFRPYVKQSS